MKKTLPSLLFLLWASVLIITYYVVQKPNLFFLTGLADTAQTLLVAVLLLFNAYGMGRRVLRLMGFDSSEAIDHFLFSIGIGLGGLGLLGLGVSVLQIAKAPILTSMQVALGVVFVLDKSAINLREDVKPLCANLNLSFSQYSNITKIAVLSPFVFSFLLTLAPQFEAFDALSYHLTQPATILRDGGLRVVDNFPFWYPNIAENVFLWTLAMGSERAAQMMHFAWMTLTALTLWHWSTKTWNIEVGRKNLLLLAAIPSLPMLASWVYTDMALAYYAVATLHALKLHRLSKSSSMLYITAVLAGLAMGVKYQSFVVPLTCGLILLFRRPFSKAFLSALRFGLIALLTALPWYLRNAIVMGNPFYPFVFGGRYWDDFLATWFANAGSGIGWDPFEIIMLPLSVILGHRDVVFFDGRFGPIFLVLLPPTIWILLSRTHRDTNRFLSLLTIGLFSALSFASWTLGVIASSSLWQSRYLFPAVLAFSIPTALGWDSLARFDTPKFKISSLMNSMIAIVIALTVFENGIFVLQRNPLAVAIGTQSREQYIERVAPSYVALMQNMDELPSDAYVYYLFDLRFYGMPRTVQTDILISNFVHDLYLYKTPGSILQNWKMKGYTHVLVYETGRQFVMDKNPAYQNPLVQEALAETLDQLFLVSQTPDKVYSIYALP